MNQLFKMCRMYIFGCIYSLLVIISSKGFKKQKHMVNLESYDRALRPYMRVYLRHGCLLFLQAWLRWKPVWSGKKNINKF